MAYLDAYARWYRPADIAEVKRKVSLLNEPVHKEVIELRPGQAARSLHALLVGVRNQAQALLDRLETRGQCPGRGKEKWSERCMLPPGIRCRRWRRAWSLKGRNEGTHSSKIAACDRRQTSH